MTVSIVQNCDRCDRQRAISGPDKAKDGGWRQIPVDKQYGDLRPEQPWLCPRCLDAVLLFVQQGVRS